MKRERFKVWRWRINRQRHLMRRSQVRLSPSKRAGLRKAAKEDFWHVRNMLPSTRWDYSRIAKRAAFLPPANMNFGADYESTLAFVMDVRLLFHERRSHLCDDGIRRPVHADFSEIHTIDPAAGLVLAAEIDRWSKSSGKKARSHDEAWQENVRDYFFDAGLFDLLQIDPQTVQIRPDNEPERSALKMLSGTLADGASARKLRLDLEALCGRGIGPRTTVYDAIAEAIGNVSHAYPSWESTYPGYRSRRWWASGTWTPSSRTVNVLLYDQGVGIPRTLPRRDYWGRLVPLLRQMDPERSDAGLIEAALAYGRTSTQIKGRGKGLADMAEWINTQGHGFLRITSGSGSLIYHANGSTQRRTLPARFCGTLVEWEFRFDA